MIRAVPGFFFKMTVGHSLTPPTGVIHQFSSLADIKSIVLTVASCLIT